MAKALKNSKKIENSTKKLNKNNKVSLSELKHLKREISLMSKMGSSAKKIKKLTNAFRQKEDTFFNAFLSGKLSKVTSDMKPFFYDSYNRINKYNYKKALNGKSSFLKGAKIAVHNIKKIEHKITRKSLIDILVRFYRFAETFDERNTTDDLYIYSNTKGMYVPINNALDRLLYSLDRNFGHGMLTLHPIVRLLEISKFTKHINTDKFKHDEALVPCNNVIFNRHTNKIMKISPKYFITHKLQADYPMGKLMDKIQNTTVKDALHYNKGDDKVYHTNPRILNEKLPEFVKNFYNDLADGHKGRVIQLLQENLDALEPYYSHEALVINYGNTHTGKSDFLKPLINIIGQSQASSLSINQLDDKHAVSTVAGNFAILGDDLKNDIEIKDGTNLLKMIRGENIYAEKKYKQGVTATYCQAIIQNTNSFPKTASKGEWINSRVLIVPFTNHFSKNDSDYLNDDLVKQLMQNPLVDDYILWLTLRQPRFSRYLRTPESKRLLRQFSNQNNPVQLFTQTIMEARKNRLCITPLYQQYKQYAKINNFKPINRTTFVERFKNCVSSCYIARERMNIQQCINQQLITSQLHLKAHDFNNKGEITNTYINDIEPGHRYQCFVFSRIPNNIVDCDINGIVFDLLPDDVIKFPDFHNVLSNEYDNCAKAFENVHIFNSGAMNGDALSKFIMYYNHSGFQKTCKHYHLPLKHAHLTLDMMATYMRIIRKSNDKSDNADEDSDYQDLLYRLNKGYRKDDKPFEYGNPQLPRLINGTINDSETNTGENKK